MSTEALVCPSCAASGAVGPDSHGDYKCLYCGTCFRRAATPARVKPVLAQPALAQPAALTRKVVVGLAAALGALVMLGVAVALLAPRGGDPGEQPSASASPSSASASPSSASASRTAPTTVSVTAQAPTKPEPEQPASASFDLHGHQPGYQTSFYALGFVTNTSPFLIEKPKVIAVLLDAAGEEVGTSFGFASRERLEPEQRSPIKLLIKDPPAHESIQYEVIVRKADWKPERLEGLRVEANEPKPASFGAGRWELAGKVHNEDAQPGKFVNIEIQALDANGQLIGLGSSFADVEILAPGASARWSTSVTAVGSVDRFEFTATAMIAK